MTVLTTYEIDPTPPADDLKDDTWIKYKMIKNEQIITLYIHKIKMVDNSSPIPNFREQMSQIYKPKIWSPYKEHVILPR